MCTCHGGMSATSCGSPLTAIVQPRKVAQRHLVERVRLAVVVAQLVAVRGSAQRAGHHSRFDDGRACPPPLSAALDPHALPAIKVGGEHPTGGKPEWQKLRGNT